MAWLLASARRRLRLVRLEELSASSERSNERCANVAKRVDSRLLTKAISIYFAAGTTICVSINTWMAGRRPKPGREGGEAARQGALFQRMGRCAGGVLLARVRSSRDEIDRPREKCVWSDVAAPK